ncbi:unnamed protein product [Caenorhabditis sp. 36 PRJEB53466]|nr:unnamed protein product [Caenorhabditis sp. 36 PRJEB53466]
MKVLALFFVFYSIAAVSAQWDNSFWWNLPQAQPQNFNWFGSSGHQSDEKGNMWHGDDNAKLMLIAKSSWP